MSFLQKIILVSLVLCLTITGTGQITVIDSIDFGSGSEPSGIVVDTVRNLVYLAGVGDSVVYVIDGQADSVIDTIEIGRPPSVICLNADSNLIYALSSLSARIFVIDGILDSVIDTVLLGGLPIAIGIDQVRNRIYVGNLTRRRVTVIDGLTNSVIDSLDIGGTFAPQGVDVNTDSNRIYVTGGGPSNDSLYVIDGSGVFLIDVIWIGGFPVGVCVNPITNRIYVTRFTGATVSVVDGQADTVIATIGVGNDPTGICVNPLTNRIYVANAGSNSVHVIDGTSNLVVDTVNVGIEPRQICINPATNKIYVSCFFGGEVWVLEDLTGGVEDVPTDPSQLNFSVSPNPFSGSTEFILNITEGAVNASFSIYDVTGTLVKSFSLRGTSSPITLSWDGKGDNGKKCASGVYIGVLKAGDNKPYQGKILLVN